MPLFSKKPKKQTTRLFFATDLHGAGATFPALLYQKWAINYSVHKSVNVDYLAVGSGEGIKRIDAKEVDFGGSDMPLTLDVLNTGNAKGVRV